MSVMFVDPAVLTDFHDRHKQYLMSICLHVSVG